VKENCACLVDFVCVICVQTVNQIPYPVSTKPPAQVCALCATSAQTTSSMMKRKPVLFKLQLFN